MAHHQERLARIALAHLVPPGKRALAEAIHRYGPIDTLSRLKAGAVPGVAARVGGEQVDPEAVLAYGERLGARVVIPEDDEWPDQLADLATMSRVDGVDDAPPICLWVRGRPHLREALDRSVAVVGARAASEYGRHVATELGYGLASRQWTVVSGGAYGIDAAAHRGALSAGGVTVAVLACGVDHAYPVGHVGLFERIADEGLLVSEWPPGVTPQRHRFLIRNRVIAAVTRGTVVVEAAARSGSRATLRRAQRLGRAAMAVPGPVTSAMSVGPHVAIREGWARLVCSTQEVLEEVGRIGDDLAPIPRGGEQPRDHLSPQAALILDALPARRPAPVEAIAHAAGVSITDVQRALPLLVAAGMAEDVAGRYRLAPSHRAPSSAVYRPTPQLR